MSSRTEAIRAALSAEPDGVLDEIARRHGAPCSIFCRRAPPDKRPASVSRRSLASSRIGARWSSFIDRPFLKRRSCSIQFVNLEGGAMFKVFVARDDKRELLPDQLARFERPRETETK